MIGAMSVVSTKNALIGLLSRGRDRAGTLRQPVLVSLTQPFFSDISPLALFAARGHPVTYRTFWGRPDQDFWLAGKGSAVVLTSSGDTSMDRVKDKYHALLESAIIEIPDIYGVGPVFMGGFRYDTQVPRDIAWRSFPNGLMILPRFLFTWSNGSRWLSINTLVTPGADAVAQAEGLINELLALNTGPLGEIHQSATKQVTQRPREEWSRWVRDALQAIEGGLLTKVVLARRKVLYAHGQFSLESVLEQLSRLYPACTIFAIDSGEASFVGATPESLASVEKGALSLACLAGSAARGSTLEEDQRLQKLLLESQKERFEHAAVVEMLVTKLKDLCLELQWNDVPQVLKLMNIQHLLTSVTGSLYPGSGILDIVTQLHPTPAVAGVPTDQALQFIRDLEGDRGWYAAPVGWVDHTGEGEFVVAIRSALLCDDRAVLYAGAGIIEGSDPDQEFQETELKFQPLLAALGGS